MPEMTARVVGEFPAQRRPTIRSLKNPMDKSTIISIFPKQIDEVKYGIEPGIFSIAAGSYESPSLLTIGSSSWWRNNIEETHPALEIPVSSVAVAESLIKDYCSGIFGCDMVTAMPGLFYVLGEINIIEVKMKYKAKLDEMKDKQHKWFSNLIGAADSLWARSNGNPLAIPDEARIAARHLGLEDKPWLQNYATAKLDNCKACGSLKNSAYPVCPVCRNVDESHPGAKGLKFAAQ